MRNFLSLVWEYPRRYDFLFWSMVPFLTLVFLYGVACLRSWIIEEKHQKIQEKLFLIRTLSQLSTLDAYVSQPDSLYQHLKGRGLFSPINRMSILSLLESLSQQKGLMLVDSRMEPAQHADGMIMTGFSVKVEANDDRQLYSFMKALEQDKSFLWYPSFFHIRRGSGCVFILELQGYLAKFKEPPTLE